MSRTRSGIQETLFYLLLSFFGLSPVFSAPALGDEIHGFGTACTTDKANGTDWDTIFQCVNGFWKRAAYFFGSSEGTCDANHRGIVQWTGSALQVCNEQGWSNIATGTVEAGSSLPTGAVMAFNLSACPSGWSALSQAAGRVIIGTGQGYTSESGNLGTNRTLLATGGAETHTLTVNEMPSHNHTGTTDVQGAHTHDYYALHYTGSGWFPNSITGTTYGDMPLGTTGSAGAHSHNVTTNYVGGGQAHTIMPPFLSLLYCQKD